jgi:hypothetical protein
VIVGDLLDNWVCPIDMTPPSMSEILKATHNEPIIGALNKVMDAGVKAIFLGGNHDQLVTGADLRAVMPRLTVAWFVDDRIYANAGAWCEKETSGSFVEVETTAKEQIVRVREWDGKDARTLHHPEKLSR